MTKCGNYFLRYEYFTTNRALHTFGKSVFGTSGCYCGNCFFDMTKIRIKERATDSTMLRCSTIRILTGGMSKRGNFFLRFKYFTTNRALLTFGKTALGTSGCYCRNDRFSMSKCGNNFLLFKYYFTNRALHTFGKTAFGTSGCYC